jgi:hypothetical protein
MACIGWGPSQFLKLTILINNTFKGVNRRETEKQQLHPRVMVCLFQKVIQEINSLQR